MPDPVLVIRDLRKSYGALAVTDGVSLDVNRGELHAIIGPNGAGKTSLVNQIAGALQPDEGSITLHGRDITRISAAARVQCGLARSFQITSVLPRFSVLENTAIVVQARSGSSFKLWDRASDEGQLNLEAMAALEAVGLAKRSQVRAGALSHGEKRQLEIALALATKAKVLLLDEPLAGTGREEAAAIVALLQKLRTDHTIVLVEHDMDAVFALADRISVLVYGRIIATGTPAEIRGNAEVRAAYLGDEAA